MAESERSLAEIASSAEERLKALEFNVFKERKELKAKVAELESEVEQLQFRVERLGSSLRESAAAARRALDEVKSDQSLRRRLGRILFGKYFYKEEVI